MLYSHSTWRAKSDRGASLTERAVREFRAWDVTVGLGAENQFLFRTVLVRRMANKRIENIYFYEFKNVETTHVPHLATILFVK